MKKTFFTLLVSLLLVCTLPQLAMAALSDAFEYDFLWPASSGRVITSLFGNREIALYGRERFHTGIDIHGAIGDDVLAIADGKVLVSVEDPGWGHYIMIHHGDNLISLYAHMDSRSVQRGDIVTAGQVIGTVGNSGLSEAPHLHFELREHGKPVQPFRYTYRNSR